MGEVEAKAKGKERAIWGHCKGKGEEEGEIRVGMTMRARQV